MYVRASRIPVDTKTKEFQYKFLNDLLVNRYWLKQWRIEQSDECVWCNHDREDIVHVFWDCTFATKFCMAWLFRMVEYVK